MTAKAYARLMATPPYRPETDHVVVTDEALGAGHGGRVLDALCSCLGSHFDVEHCTFQLEARSHAGHEAPVHD